MLYTKTYYRNPNTTLTRFLMLKELNVGFGTNTVLCSQPTRLDRTSRTKSNIELISYFKTFIYQYYINYSKVLL